MPKNSPVHKMYEAIKKQKLAEGMDNAEAESHAARISQAKTGQALATGKPPKKKRLFK